jgi:hypothetical protein
MLGGCLPGHIYNKKYFLSKPYKNKSLFYSHFKTKGCYVIKVGLKDTLQNHFSVYFPYNNGILLGYTVNCDKTIDFEDTAALKVQIVKAIEEQYK